MADEFKIAEENWKRYQLSRDRGHLAFQKAAKRNENYYIGGGKQWDENVRAILEAENRPVIEINEILPRINSVVGHQINNRMMVKLRPKRNKADANTADSMTKIFMHLMNLNEFHWKETNVFTDGLIMKRGYFDVRVAFDDNFNGELDIGTLDPLAVIPDPFATSYDPDDWDDVIVTEWLGFQQVVDKYGLENARKMNDMDIPWDFEDGIERNRFAHNEEVETTTSIDDEGNRSIQSFVYHDDFDADLLNHEKRRVRVIDRQYWKESRIEVFVDPKTGDFRNVPDTWEHNRIAFVKEKFGWIVVPKDVKRVRWTVSAGQRVLHDEWSPYNHFTVVPFFCYFRRGKTIGMVDNLIGPQDQLNKMASSVQHIVGSTANSGWLVEEDSLVEMDIDDLEQDGGKTGVVIEYKRGSTPPEKIKPNQIPTAIEKIIARTHNDFDTISGVSQSFQGQQGREITGVAIKNRINQGTIQLGGPLDNLGYTRRLMTRNVVDILQKFYSEHQIILITKTDEAGEEQQEEIEINAPQADGTILNDLTAGEYVYTVESAPNHSTFDSDQFNQMMEMRRLNIFIPDDEVIKRSSLSEREAVAERVRLVQGGQTKEAIERNSRLAELEEADLTAEIQKKLADVQKLLADAERAKAGAMSTAVETAVDVALAPKLAAAASNILDDL